MIEMPDVNVLVALMDRLHVHHQVAQKWFEKASQTGWVACPLTLNGAIRVISRPQPPRIITIPEAGSLLQTLIDANRAAYHFWPDDVSLLDTARFDLSRLQGYRQLTDLHLLGIALRNGGTLATLDTGFHDTLKAVLSPPVRLLNVLLP